jgi:Protein of unknown function (DUF3363)
MDRRVDHLVEEGLARRQGQRVIFARDLIDTLRRRDLEEAASKLSAETGLAYRPSTEGEHVSGIYRQRVTLSSGRFAMIDDGMGFQLVSWRPALEQQLGRQVDGVVAPGSNVDWSFGRKRGLGIWRSHQRRSQVGSRQGGGRSFGSHPQPAGIGDLRGRAPGAPLYRGRSCIRSVAVGSPRGSGSRS